MGIGQVKLNADIMEKAWYRNANTVRVYFHLLLLASEDGSGDEAFITYRQIEKALGISIVSIHRIIDNLQKEGEISILETTQKGTLIRINSVQVIQKENMPNTSDKDSTFCDGTLFGTQNGTPENPLQPVDSQLDAGVPKMPFGTQNGTLFGTPIKNTKQDGTLFGTQNGTPFDPSYSVENKGVTSAATIEDGTQNGTLFGTPRFSPPTPPSKVDDNINITNSEISVGDSIKLHSPSFARAYENTPSPQQSFSESQGLPLLPPPSPYPDLDGKGVQEVMAAALLSGHRISETDAKHFISHYAAQNWRGTNGNMLNWRFKVVEWAINNEKGLMRTEGNGRIERDRTKPGF